MNLSNQEKQEWILANCVNEYRGIILSDLKFPNHEVYLSSIEAEEIHNNKQQAKRIRQRLSNKQKKYLNDHQIAEEIYSNHQKAERIYNNSQEAKEICNNDHQAAKEICNNNQVIIETKSPIQKKIDELQEKLNELKEQAENV